MFPDASQPTLPTAAAYSAPAVVVPEQKVPQQNVLEQKVSPSRLDLQEDFGRIIRRIMYSNSGNFEKFSPENATGEDQSGKTYVVENAEWSMCRSEAQLASALNKMEVSELLWLRALEIASAFALAIRVCRKL